MLYLIALLASQSAFAQNPSEGIQHKFWGSTGTELHLTPDNRRSPLNPSGILNIPFLSNSADVTLFGDIGPEDRKWKAHFKLRTYNEWSRESQSKGEVNEAYFSWSAAKWIDFSVGRRIERWGTGYGWNPTGVVNPLKDPRDPTDRRDRFRGVDQASVDLFVKGWNFTGMVVPLIPYSSAARARPVPVGWAARAYRLIHGFDFSLSASGGSGLPNSQGVSFSRTFGKALELHGEAAVFHNTVRWVPSAGVFHLERRPHAEVLLGGQYTFPHLVNLTVEYYHNGANLSGREWMEFQRLTGSQSGNLLLANRHFMPLGMATDYVFNRIAWPVRLNKLDVEMIAITAVRDRSSAIRPAIYWRITPNVTLYSLVTEFTGAARSEMKFIPIERQIDVGIRFRF